jgi:outer membrane lipoprotein-sorting protein
VTALGVLLLNCMMWANELSKLAITGLALCVCAGGQSLPATNDAAQAQLSSIVQSLERTQSQNRAGNAYVVTREYRLMDTRSSRVSSRVVAQVQYLPPDQKAYIIQDRTGSGRGEQVVKRILDHESEMSRRNSQASAAALNEGNYNFSYLGTDTVDGNQCYVLGLRPKRRETELIVGQAWVDKNTFQVRRIEGDVAKTPSWMLKKVHVTLNFADVSGNWLQTGMEAVADVRFVGSQTLQSKTLDYRVTGEVAAKVPPRHPSQIRRSIPAELLFKPGSSPR